MLRLIKSIDKIFYCLAILLLLTSCDGATGSWCLTTNPKAFLSNSTITNSTSSAAVVNATGTDPSNPSTPPGGWINSQVSLAESSQFSVSATGNILIAMPYGLASGQTNNFIEAAGEGSANLSSYYDNGGLGTQTVVMADSTTPYTLYNAGTTTPFYFTPGQQVYVNTENCATGDYTGATPSKWTWEGWDTTAVRCSTRGTRNFTVQSPYCKAIAQCHSSCAGTSYQAWQCQYVVISDTTAIIDTCGNSAPDPTYNCQSNSASTTACYDTTSYIAQGDWCGGSRQACGSAGSKSDGITISNNSPSCGMNDANQNITTPVLNTCGSTDSCWNTGGYRLYAIQTGVVCPTDPNCIHLDTSAEVSGGQTFSANGGSISLKIFDPNTETTSTVDTTTLQTTYNSNQTAITQAQTDQTNQMNLIYQVVGSTILSDGSVATSNGLLLQINDMNGQLTQLANTASSYEQSNSAIINMDGISQDLSTLSGYFATFASQLSPSDDATIPWNLLGQMQAQVNDLISLNNGLTTQGTTSTSNPSSSDITSFQSNLASFLTSLNNDINSAINANNQAAADGATIDQLTSSNDTIAAQLLAANNTTSSVAVGGYTTYVRSDPVVATNGKYVQAIFSNGDPNNGGNIVNLGQLDQIGGNSPQVFTAPTGGSVWLSLQDPDKNYGNNAGLYNVNISVITQTPGFTSIFTAMVNFIENGVMKAVQSMYQNITCTGTNTIPGNCTDYISLINIGLTLYVIIYGIMFMFGLVQVSYLDLVTRAVKIGFIVTLLSPAGYQFFNTFLFQFFLDVSNSLLSNMTGAPTSDPFDFLGQSIALMLFDPITYLKILSFLLVGGLGFVLFVMLLYGSIQFIKAIFNAFKVYIMCFVGLAMCFALTPIFLPCILFSRTQPLFDNWIKAMIRFSLEPVILFIGLIFLNGMMVNLLYQLFNFSVCYKCALPVMFSLPGYSWLGLLVATAYCIPGFAPWGVDTLGGGIVLTVFISLPVVISFCMVGKIMEIYSRTFAHSITVSIFSWGTMFSSSGHAEMGYNPFSGVQSMLGIDKASKERRTANRQGLADSMARKAAERLNPEAAKAAPATNKAEKPKETKKQEDKDKKNEENKENKLVNTEEESNAMQAERAPAEQ